MIKRTAFPLALRISLLGTILLATLGAHLATQAAARRSEQSSGTRALLIAVSAVDERVAWASGSLGTWVRTVDGGDVSRFAPTSPWRISSSTAATPGPPVA